MNKKAQGLSMNTIIIAALAILVLILLLFIMELKISQITLSNQKFFLKKGTGAVRNLLLPLLSYNIERVMSS